MTDQNIERDNEITTQLPGAIVVSQKFINHLESQVEEYLERIDSSEMKPHHFTNILLKAMMFYGLSFFKTLK